MVRDIISQEITEHAVKLCETDRRALAALVSKTGETENMAIQSAIQTAFSANTPARRKASSAHHAKRAKAGYRKMTFWLSPDSRATLAKLRTHLGSNDKAIEAALSMADDFIS